MIAAEQLDSGDLYRQVGRSANTLQLAQIAVTPDATSTAAASISGFDSSADKLTVTNAGPDLVDGTAIDICVEMYGVQPANPDLPYASASQTLVSNCVNDKGWTLDVLNTGAVRLSRFSAGGVATNVTLPEKMMPGVNHITMSITNAGGLKISQNGNTATTLLAGGYSYTLAGATAQYILGGINTARAASGQPLVEGRIINHSVISAALSDADLATAANATNITERYLPATVVSGHVSLKSCMQATDWDGVSGTLTAGSGSTPTTWTVAGTLVKNTITAEYVYNVHKFWFADQNFTLVRTYQGGVGTYQLRNPLAQFKFACATPTRIGITMSSDTGAGSLSAGSVPLHQSALRIAGVPQGCGAIFTEVDLARTSDWLAGSFTAANEFTSIDGFHSNLTDGGANRGICAQNVRVPIATPITAITTDRTNPVRRTFVLSDSISGAFALCPATYGWPAIMRENLLAAGKGRLTADYAGGRSWKDECVDAPTITASIVRIGDGLDGTTINILYASLGTNDYAHSLWTAAAMQTQVEAFFDAFHAAFPNATVILQSPTTQTTEGANGVGNTMAQYRTALANVATGRAYITYVDGSTLMVTTLLQDGIHPTQTGHAYLEKRMSDTISQLDYASQVPCLSNGTIYTDSGTTNVWIADSGNVDGASVGTWTASKGGINSTQPTAGSKPTFSSSSWAATIAKGGITYDGTDDWLKHDALAASVSGSDKAFRWTIVVQPLTIATKFFQSFDHSTTATQGFHDFAMLVTSGFMTSSRKPDSGAGNLATTTQAVTTGRMVITYDFAGTTITIRKNGVVTSVNATSQDVATMTVDQATEAAFRGSGTPTGFANIRMRARMFAPVANDPVSYTIDEGYFLAEAA